MKTTKILDAIAHFYLGKTVSIIFFGKEIVSKKKVVKIKLVEGYEESYFSFIFEDSSSEDVFIESSEIVIFE